MNYTKSIEAWAANRGLDNADPAHQLNKLMEEVGELAEALNKGWPDKLADSFGDTYVVLTILAMQCHLSIEDCIRAAYDVIKDRDGKLVNGTFVKEKDLEEP